MASNFSHVSIRLCGCLLCVCVGVWMLLTLDATPLLSLPQTHREQKQSLERYLDTTDRVVIESGFAFYEETHSR